MYFDKLITRIVAHGGDVIKFAGDALQVVWRNRATPAPEASGGRDGSPVEVRAVNAGAAPQDSLPGLVLRACNCCLDLLINLNNFVPVDGVVLKLHMGVGAGDLDEFYVGGHHGKWCAARQPPPSTPATPL